MLRSYKKVSTFASALRENNVKMRIVITGASGFIGSHIAQAAARAGHEVWCAVRRTSSRRWLTDKRLSFVTLPLTDEAAIRQAMESIAPDAVVHAAGATKCRRASDFLTVNAAGTATLCRALTALAKRPRLVMMSSLSAVNSIPGEALGKPTAYGLSKLRAEEAVRASGLPFVILRPTGVYGPRERDYYMMFASIQRHIDIAAGFGEQRLTFVYVADLVQAVLLALTSATAQGHTLPVTDGQEYTSRQFSDFIKSALRCRALRVTVPLPVLRLVCLCGELYNRMGGLTTLNSDKYAILSQRSWHCDIAETRRLLGYKPTVGLEEGVGRCAAWYKEQKWL